MEVLSKQQEEFIKEILLSGYTYKIKGSVIIIDYNGPVYINSLTSIPENIHFNNNGSVELVFLKILPRGIEFNNRGNVSLEYLKIISEKTKFNNKGDVFLNSIKNIFYGVEFNNSGEIRSWVYRKLEKSCPPGINPKRYFVVALNQINK